MKKKLLITAGGTGGHIYPAVAIAQQIAEQRPDIEYLFVGGNLAKNRYFDTRKFPYRTIDSSTFSLRQPTKIPGAIAQLAKGFMQSRTIIQDFQPDLVIGFGSYYTLPVLAAAKWTGTPFVLHEANSILGKVNRLMSPYAFATAVHFPFTEVKKNGIEVGMPIRFKKGTVSRKEALQYYGLEEGLPTLLIFGGSQGAKALNRVAQGRYQAIHLTGEDTSALKAQYQQAGIKACVKPFEDQMPYAWEAADAVVCRSGAGTIAEILEFEVPALMIPFPAATENHQEHNARFISDTIQAGITLPQHLADNHNYQSALDRLWENKNEFQKKMKEHKTEPKKQDLFTIITKILDGKYYG